MALSCLAVSRLWHQLPPSASKLFAHGNLTFCAECELVCLPGKFRDNPIQIALGSYCRSNQSQVGLACWACTLGPRLRASFKLPSEDRCDERKEHKLGKFLFVVAYHWEEPGVEEAMFLCSWLSANWLIYMCTVCLSVPVRGIFRPFSSGLTCFSKNLCFIP